MRTARITSTLGLALLLSAPSVPLSAASPNHGEAHWVHAEGSLDGTLEPMPDLSAPASRQGHGEMMANFEDEKWVFRVSGSGTCTKVDLDILVTYPGRAGDWAKSKAVAETNDATHNFCTPGTRGFHGTGRIIGGGGHYSKSEGEFPFTGLLTGMGPTSREEFHLEFAGLLRCYHLGSAADRAH
jgi:hypothetical protein